MNKKNILIIVSDQLSQKALPTYGNNYVQTPNIDRIANGAIVFNECYTPYPLCQPARAALWSGRLPHQTKIESNGRNHFVPPYPSELPTLGSIFAEAGYDTTHFGKTHDAGTLRGFRVEPECALEVEGSDAFPVNYDTKRDRYTTVKVVDYLSKQNEKPYLLIADLQNPHDICNWVGHNKGVHKNIPIDKELPALPDNFYTSDFKSRPKPVQYICCSHRRQCQATGWTEDNYRQYLAAYYHYIERLDAEIGLILDALEKRNDAKDTLIVFLADHGDGMAAHGLVTKQVSFYEETTHVPLFFKGQGFRTDRNTAHQLVSLMDILPTLCDYAELETPEGLWGKSLLPILKGENEFEVHEYIVSEWLTEWGFTMEPGRMIRTRNYKYMKYLEENAEELYNISEDRGEQTNLISSPECKSILEHHRSALQEYINTTGDNFNSIDFKIDSRWRSHKPGYENHTGVDAPTAMTK
ncbi:MAG: sulfatase-like hydrolase/transferase [Firmicutes bacterium]|nr:sulfatase-like hydrolase/transferase [Bacillota bacterium]